MSWGGGFRRTLRQPKYVQRKITWPPTGSCATSKNKHENKHATQQPGYSTKITLMLNSPLRTKVDTYRALLKKGKKKNAHAQVFLL